MAGNKTLTVSVFSADPQATDGGLQLKHWLRQLEHLFAEPETAPTAAAKLATLHSKIDYWVYHAIAQCTTYDLSIAELKRLYIKEKSPVYARYLLQTRRQQPNEAMDHYAQELRQLLLDSVREPRTPAQAQDDRLLDAFIAGVSSQELRLKLLEKTDLTFATALEQATVYTEARMQSNAYDRTRLLAGTSLHARPESATEDVDPLAKLRDAPEDDPALTAAVTTSRPKALRGAACFFCGGPRHARVVCPARDAICHLCSLKGHYAKVCKKTARGSRHFDSRSRGRAGAATLNGLIAEPASQARHLAPYPTSKGRAPLCGPLGAQTSLAGVTGQPPPSHSPSGTKAVSLAKLRATQGALKLRQAPRTPRVVHDLTAAPAPTKELRQLANTTEAFRQSDQKCQKAISNTTEAFCQSGQKCQKAISDTTEAFCQSGQKCQKAISDTTEAFFCQKCQKAMSHTTEAFSRQNCRILNRETPECWGKPSDDDNGFPMVNADSGHDRKTAAGVGSTREAGPTHSGGSVPLLAASSGLAQALIPLMVEGHCVRALVDTGSTDSFIDQRLVLRHGWRIWRSTRRIFMASQGLRLSTKGECRLKLVLKGWVFPDVHLMVLPALGADILLGHDFLKLHGRLVMEFGGPDTLVVGADDALAVCALAQMDVQPLSLFPNLTSDCTPVAVKSRRYSPADMQFIADETAQLLKDGIIEPSRSPWRAQVLVVRSEAHRKRMVIDYSQTINRFTQLDAYPLPGMDALVQQVSQYSVYSTLDLRSAYHQIPISRADRIYTTFESGQRLYQFTRLPFGVPNGVACFQRAMDDLVAREHLTDVFVYLDNFTVCGYDQGHHDANLKRFLEVAQW
uniref:uncharacterized protein isoform X1 n=1 Tax=Myxine glutinosa TaxID=7769 RepID=UPI00358E16DD